MFNVDTETGKIRMHRGDTGSIVYVLSGYGFEEGDVAVFTMKSRDGKMVKQQILEPNEDDEVEVTFAYKDTYRLPEEVYVYDIRIFQGVTLDDDGKITDGTYVDTPMDEITIELKGTVGIE